jgi:hypothetical protein
MSTVIRHDVRITQRDDGWEVARDRRVLIDQLDEDEALLYAEKNRLPDEPVILVREDGREQDITRDLRRQVRR